MTISTKDIKGLIDKAFLLNPGYDMRVERQACLETVWVYGKEAIPEFYDREFWDRKFWAYVEEVREFNNEV